MRAEDGSDDHNRRHQGKPRCRANDILRLVLQRENENSNTGQCFQKGYNGKAHLVRITFSQPLREECNHRSFSLLHFGAIIAYASSPPQPCLLPRGTEPKGRGEGISPAESGSRGEQPPAQGRMPASRSGSRTSRRRPRRRRHSPSSMNTAAQWCFRRFSATA